MTIEELARRKEKSIPNSKLVKYYEAAIPQYHMEVVFTMLKEKSLSVLQEFILKFIDSGIKDIQEIKRFLGINETVINSAIAFLQREEMVVVDIFNSKLRMTDKGENILKVASMIVPEEIEYPMYMDGLLGNVYFDTKKLFTKNEVKRFDLTAIVPDKDVPTISDLNYEDVKSAMNAFKRNYVNEKNKLNGNLQEITKIEKIYIEYKKVFVLIFKNDKTEEIELQVYVDTIRNDDYSTILQKMFNEGVKVFKFDRKSEVDGSKELPLMSSLPAEVINNAKKNLATASSYARNLDSLKTQLMEMKENSQIENSVQEQYLLEKKIQQMENEREGSDRVLSTYDHRPLLIDALTNAKKSVIIISPWIKKSGLDNEILRLIENAIRRKTQVIIGYGISEKEDSDKRIIKKLNDICKEKNGKYLKLVRLSNTHEKILIKDNEFLVITSFNWLSFRGNPEWGFRQETGYCIKSNKTAIADMKDKLSDRLGFKI